MAQKRCQNSTSCSPFSPDTQRPTHLEAAIGLHWPPPSQPCTVRPAFWIITSWGCLYFRWATLWVTAERRLPSSTLPLQKQVKRAAPTFPIIQNPVTGQCHYGNVWVQMCLTIHAELQGGWQKDQKLTEYLTKHLPENSNAGHLDTLSFIKSKSLL